LDVTIVLFSAALLAEHTQYRIALLVYWVNILLLGLTVSWSWVSAAISSAMTSRFPFRGRSSVALSSLSLDIRWALGCVSLIPMGVWRGSFWYN